MKTRLQKLILSLLIAGLCVNCALPALADENIVNSEKKFLEECVGASEKIFFQLYSQLWIEHDLDRKLVDAIDRGVNEKMHSMLLGTRSARMMLEENQKEALEMVINLFNPHYEKFILDLEKRFGDENNKEVAIFYENLSDDAVAQNKNAAIKAHLSKTTGEILKKDAKALRSQIAKSIRKKHSGAYIKTGTTEIGITAPDFSRQVNLTALRLGVSAAAGAAATAGAGVAMGTSVAAGSIVATAIPIAGAVVGVWAGYKMASSIYNAPEELKTKLNFALSESLTTQQPGIYWEAMESDVRLIIEEASAVFKQNFVKAIDSAVTPEVRAMIDRSLREKQ